MQVLRMLTDEGVVFFQGMPTARRWSAVELVSMTPEEYQAIPATVESSEVFDSSPDGPRQPHSSAGSSEHG